MPSLNRVTFIGHIGNEVRKLSSKDGKPGISFSIATSEGTKTKQITQWHNCAFWAPWAHSIGINTGDLVFAEGQATSNKKDGKTYHNNNIKVLHILKKKEGSSSGSGFVAEDEVDPAWLEGEEDE